MSHDVTVSREIDAPAAEVWAVLTDITRMGELSPETVETSWNEGFSEMALGARWTGRNVNGDNQWSTEAEITEFVDGQRFVFDCDWSGYVFATWGYEVIPTETGCTVTEFTTDHRSDDVKAGSVKISGIVDRDARNAETMAATLNRLAEICEA